MISKTEDEYEHEVCDAIDNDELTVSESIVASRKCSFDNLDTEYIDALRYLSMRVECPLCHRKKGQLCAGGIGFEPAHKSRMRLLEFSSQKVYENLRYILRSKKWKGDRVVIKIKGKWKIVECSDPQWKEKVKQWKTEREKN